MIGTAGVGAGHGRSAGRREAGRGRRRGGGRAGGSRSGRRGDVGGCRRSRGSGRGATGTVGRGAGECLPAGAGSGTGVGGRAGRSSGVGRGGAVRRLAVTLAAVGLPVALAVGGTRLGLLAGGAAGDQPQVALLGHIGGSRRPALGRAGANRQRPVLGGLNVAAEAFTVGLAANAISLGVLDAGRVALDTDPERDAEVERLLVGEPELACKLVDPDPCCQVLCQVLSPAGGRSCSNFSILPRLARVVRSGSMAEPPTSVRKAREKARFRAAASRQSADPAHSHAPRPGNDRPSRS